MPDSIYFGTYARFDTASKKEASQLLGADNLVGDIFDIEFVVEDGKRIAWMRNRFGALLGYFDEDISRQLSIYEARGWKCQALLSFFAYNEAPEPGHYWGEAAIVCYERGRETAFGPYVRKLSSRMGEGMRPVVDLGESGIAQIIESEGVWAPTNYIPLPEKNAGTAILKTRRSFTEKMVEQGRKGNKGCYFVSWVLMLGAVAALIFGLRACGVF